MLPRILFVIVCLSIAFSISAQEDEKHAIAQRRSILYHGPGITFYEAGVLQAGMQVTIIERSQVGNWVYIQRNNDERVVLEGWLPGGYLSLSPALSFAEVPVSSLHDADPQNVRSQSMSRLYETPVIPRLSTAMISVFEEGQERGNNPAGIAKVGDSLSATDQYISIFSAEEHILGPYVYLQETLDHYAESTKQENIAAQVGLTTYVVFDPFWATSEQCEHNEDPLRCAYRTQQPSIAFIAFGANDVRHMTDEEFAQQMRMIAQITLEHGIIPVLSTFSAHPDEELFWQSINFNLRVQEIAAEYEVPLINLWSAVQALPDYGLDQDRVHLTQTGYTYLKYDDGLEAYSGIALQNLLVLRTLHEIRTQLEEHNPSTADPAEKR